MKKTLFLFVGLLVFMNAQSQDNSVSTWTFADNINVVANTDPTIALGHPIMVSDIHQEIIGNLLLTAAWNPTNVQGKYIKLPILINSDTYIDSISVEMASYDQKYGMPLSRVSFVCKSERKDWVSKPQVVTIKRSVINREHVADMTHVGVFSAGDTAYVYIRAYEGSIQSHLLVSYISVYSHRSISTDFFEDEYDGITVEKTSDGNIKLFSPSEEGFHVVNSNGDVYFSGKFKGIRIVMVEPDDVYTITTAGVTYTINTR